MAHQSTETARQLRWKEGAFACMPSVHTTVRAWARIHTHARAHVCAHRETRTKEIQNTQLRRKFEGGGMGGGKPHVRRQLPLSGGTTPQSSGSDIPENRMQMLPG